ncbi:hypothetical protein TRIATDRAFT_53926 [Trichoderma atroviride IMI 206040]|uniref:F-box domain-containing protein n=1 Tax=Hypocrea atroviridis (strain ATCC 20476 / IMI 206040) TaxID=452589 RepID=G9NKU9_HYPAI|nr:uncharacterized protein TRIATDRAFT_53926 [Trichoderma atroviride IMI 206040]EHK48520.1 hypothetical protein TRIATDRAFT_53926 [Trichoderma atroviride IMI 206040]
MGIWKQIFRFLRPIQSSSPQPDPPDQPTSPHLGRLEIPTEIILMIAKHLDKPSLICFALSCQTLKRYCFPKSLDLSFSEKSEFLLLLEKDAAKYYFCHLCAKLHPWHACWFEHSHLSMEFYTKDIHHCRMINWFNLFSLSIPYPLARVVMNRHFYGAAHGVHVDKLAYRGKLTDPSCGWTSSREWGARIIDDQLMLSSIMSLGPLRDSEGLRAVIDTGLASLCQHITAKVLFPLHQIPTQVLLGSQPDHVAQRLQSVNSCPICMTDYCIDVNWQETGWTIEIITYHMLGDIRSPWDWTWVAMAYLPYKALKVPRFKQPSGNQPGIVKHMWSKSDDDIFQPTGEWVTVDWHPFWMCILGCY